MGPQLDSCGREEARNARQERLGASMGPQLDSCGRAATNGKLARKNLGFNGAAT